MLYLFAVKPDICVDSSEVRNPESGNVKMEKEYSMKGIAFSLVICVGIAAVTFSVCGKMDSSGRWIDRSTPVDAQPCNKFVGSGWKLEFSDEFNDGRIDTTKWVVKDEYRGSRPELGIERWFFKPEAVEERDGNLFLDVRKVGKDTMYCGSVYSNGKYYMHHGYAEARIRLADIRMSALTAFWLQSPTMRSIDGTGNDGAEIDIFESAYTSDTIITTIHIDGYEEAHREKNFRYAAPGIHEDYHIWGMWWDDDGIRIFLDGELKAEFDGIWVPRKEIDEYLYLSTVATFSGEGDFVSQPADSSLTQACFDYVRVWTKSR